MARTLSYSVAAGDAGMRLDALAALRGLYPSRSAAARAAEGGRIFVNGDAASKKQSLAAGDLIVYTVEGPRAAPGISGQPIPLDIRYEDDDILVIAKQAGLICHPSPENPDNTLVNALIYHCGAENLCNVQGHRDRLGIVHRLDRDTTGLMLAAKTDTAGYALMADIRKRAVDRRYLALAQGIIRHDTGMVDAPIARGERDRTRMAVRDTHSSRDSVTTFTVLERFEAGRHDEGYTLIDCKLFTGRTHQIRVHLNYIKHACVGDPVYGTGASPAQLGLTRQFLHSYLLRFTHPATGRDMEFFDALPADLAGALGLVQGRSLGRTQAGERVVAALSPPQG